MVDVKINEVISKGKDIAIDAVWIIAGAFAARFLVGELGKRVPMVAQNAAVGTLVLGAVGAAFTSGVIQKVFMGAGVAGALGLIETVTAQPATVKG